MKPQRRYYFIALGGDARNSAPFPSAIVVFAAGI